MAQTDQLIKKLLFARIYRHPEIMRIRAGASKIVTDLFEAYMNDPTLMRSHYWVDHISGLKEAAKARHVSDYLAGMTDTYAVRVHGELFDQTPDLR
ncbi:deoxyguanosinetriphosphate triphosphohydrolase-like protein [compost metagenome]